MGLVHFPPGAFPLKPIRSLLSQLATVKWLQFESVEEMRRLRLLEAFLPIDAFDEFGEGLGLFRPKANQDGIRIAQVDLEKAKGFPHQMDRCKLLNWVLAGGLRHLKMEREFLERE